MSEQQYRIGIGFDIHKLVEGRDLIIGGVKIPYEKGLEGHSDADVLVHAIMDALLGAAALGDIGKHFPDTDPKYKGASSIRLLEQVGNLIDQNLYVIVNIDATIIAQKPKMAPYIILKQCVKMWQIRFIWNCHKSISKRQRKKVLDLREKEKGYQLRPLLRWRRLQITAMLWVRRTEPAGSAADARIEMFKSKRSRVAQNGDQTIR